MSLIIKNLSARVKDGADILNGIDLEIPSGEVHAIMGPNGSGKSTLSKVLCGHPDYEVTGGSVTLDGQDLLAMSVDERSRAGLFLAFQYPVEVPGVSNANFMRAAMQARLPEGEEVDAVAFYKQLRGNMKQLGMDT
ncbi:MAG: ATP-binding cassette domain-containing protein, partial [Akkermansia sp.]|nr:ATP-binding cassette domain-containing protein [Akkermansia sp.]